MRKAPGAYRVGATVGVVDVENKSTCCQCREWQQCYLAGDDNSVTWHRMTTVTWHRMTTVLPGTGWQQCYLAEDDNSVTWHRMTTALPGTGWQQCYLAEDNNSVTWRRITTVLPGRGWQQCYLARDDNSVTWRRMTTVLPGPLARVLVTILIQLCRITLLRYACDMRGLFYMRLTRNRAPFTDLYGI
jgi:hypothetical protein